MAKGILGKEYQDGDIIVQQGQEGESMYVMQAGEVEVLHERDDQQVRLTVLGEGDFFGEVPLFERARDPGKVRVTVRALGQVRVLIVDRKTILRRIHEDPSLAYRILETMSRRIQELENEMVRLIVGDEA